MTTNLSYCNLTGADLRRITLTGADLIRANLTGADLTEADLIRANLTGAKADVNTKFPAGFDIANSGIEMIDIEV